MISLHSTRRWHGELPQSTLLTAPSRREPSDVRREKKSIYSVPTKKISPSSEGAKQRFTLATMRFILRMQRFIAKYFMQSKALHFIISPPTHVRALHQTPHPGMRQTKRTTQVRVEFRPLYPGTRLSKKQATEIFPSLAYF